MPDYKIEENLPLLLSTLKWSMADLGRAFADWRLYGKQLPAGIDWNEVAINYEQRELTLAYAISDLTKVLSKQ